MEDTDRDFFMSAFEAKDYGLIDSVIEHPTDIAVRSSGIPMYAGELWLGSKLLRTGFVHVCQKKNIAGSTKFIFMAKFWEGTLSNSLPKEIELVMNRYFDGCRSIKTLTQIFYLFMLRWT